MTTSLDRDHLMAASAALSTLGAPEAILTLARTALEETILDVVGATAEGRARAITNRHEAILALVSQPAPADPDEVSHEHLYRVSQRLNAEILWWVAAIIRVADAKIAPDDAEYAMLRRLLRTVQMDQALNRVSLAEVQDLIARNRS